jgi:septum formation protein
MHRFDLIIGVVRLILASASPRRAELLRAAGFSFETLAVDIDEDARDGEAPATYVRRLAAEKSAAAAADLKVRTTTVVVQAFRPAATFDAPVILGADTTVVVDGQILGKPRDDGDAAAMLRRLSGRRHDVLTGISLRRGACELGRVETSAVYFAPLTAEDIAWYVTSGEGRDKAGAYAIQGLASRFIPRIEGSYSNVVGLPIAAVSELLKELHA